MTDSHSEPVTDLKARVQQFHALELPGQPMGMHVGTSYLVSDLWREVERLSSINAYMLAALKDITKAYGLSGDTPSIERARAAIAKAERKPWP